MRKGILILLAMITMVYYADKANAAFLLEPYAGTQFISSYETEGTGAGSEGDITGSAIGLKLGFKQMGFNFGLNGQRSSWTFTPEEGDESDVTYTRMGAFIGYDLPIGIRLWAEYVFSFSGTADDENLDSEYKEGSGTAFGFGYQVIPFLSLNLEMANLQTATFVNNGTESDFNVDYQTFIFSVSLPFSI